MTSDGVDGTAAARRSRPLPPGPVAAPWFIKRDDGRLRERYIEPRISHAPAGATPSSCRRERQVAFALRTFIDFAIASLIRGTAGTPGWGADEVRPKGCR